MVLAPWCEDDLRSTGWAQHTHGGLYQDRESTRYNPISHIKYISRNAIRSHSFAKFKILNKSFSFLSFLQINVCNNNHIVVTR